MKQVLIKGGQAIVSDMPAPMCSSKNILVATEYSCISAGTEMAGLNASALPLYKRALAQPDNVKRVMEMVKDQGLKRTVQRVQGKLSAGAPTGYSAAGVVIEVGSEVEGYEIGDKVACAGAGIANHAEIIDVPVNLCCKVPKNVSVSDASTVTLGAIAMQGVRRIEPTLGEVIVVVGLGILGQITAQMLTANGCLVVGVDFDVARLDLAKEKGVYATIDLNVEDYTKKILELTDGFGADAVVVTAAGKSNDIISQAMRACRKKGRVILVGDVGLDIKRGDFYAKELDFLISCSYGPGRYDPTYEEGGQDYPLPYVRWTENRNMQAYLQLIATNRLSLEGIVQAIHEIDNAGEAYASLNSGAKPLIVLLKYPERENKTTRFIQASNSIKKCNGKINVGLAGAGGFAQGMHLPNMVKQRKDYVLKGVMTRTGSNAVAVASQYEADFSTTDYKDVLDSSDVDLVLIATRHNLHASMVIDALKAGKHVFVEKPLAMTPEELEEIQLYFQNNETNQVLMTGYNRRFSPAVQKAKSILENRDTPMIVNYRMNAGHIPRDHWVHGEEGGGRNIGEACHIYDVFNFLTGSKFLSVEATSIGNASGHMGKNDNFVATVKYEDGSVCTLTYTALGAKEFAKESMDIFCGGKVLSLDDYKSLSVAGSKHKGWSSSSMQKGQYEELEALADTLLRDGEWPVSLDDQIAATQISFLVEDAL